MVTRDVREGREIEFNVRSCTHRIGLVGHEVSETVKLCVAAIYTNTKNDGISFFKISSLVVLTQRWARHVPDRTRDIGAFCIETHFTEERFELKSTTEATEGPTKQAWYTFRRIWSGKLPELNSSAGLAVVVEVELPQALKQLQTLKRGRYSQDRHTKGESSLG